MIKQRDQWPIAKLQAYNILQIYHSQMNPKPVVILAFLSILSLYLLSFQSPLNQSTFISFDQFKRDFNKTYSSPAEEAYRKIIFSNNENRISRHNSDLKQTFRLGVTQFADLTEDEFVATYLGGLVGEKVGNSLGVSQENSVKITEQPKHLKQASTDLDWSTRGHVTPPRNQGVCGSCWAFSTAAALQSSYSIYKADLTYLSPQQLIDCSSSYGNNGCNGGRMDYAFRYIKDHGLSTEKQYPYVGRQQGCKKDFGNYKIASYATVSECTSLYMALHQRPISVGVDASTWALYKQGILSICGHNINHGALLVGVADSFWKIKNSWGTSWGENGFIRIGRGNTCGVCETAAFPLV